MSSCQMSSSRTNNAARQQRRRAQTVAIFEEEEEEYSNFRIGCALGIFVVIFIGVYSLYSKPPTNFKNEPIPYLMYEYPRSNTYFDNPIGKPPMGQPLYENHGRPFPNDRYPMNQYHYNRPPTPERRPTVRFPNNKYRPPIGSPPDSAINKAQKEMPPFPSLNRPRMVQFPNDRAPVGSRQHRRNPPNEMNKFPSLDKPSMRKYPKDRAPIGSRQHRRNPPNGMNQFPSLDKPSMRKSPYYAPPVGKPAIERNPPNGMNQFPSLDKPMRKSPYYAPPVGKPAIERNPPNGMNQFPSLDKPSMRKSPYYAPPVGKPAIGTPPFESKFPNDSPPTSKSPRPPMNQPPYIRPPIGQNPRNPFGRNPIKPIERSLNKVAPNKEWWEEDFEEGDDGLDIDPIFNDDIWDTYYGDDSWPTDPILNNNEDIIDSEYLDEVDNKLYKKNEDNDDNLFAWKHKIENNNDDFKPKPAQPKKVKKVMYDPNWDLPNFHDHLEDDLTPEWDNEDFY